MATGQGYAAVRKADDREYLEVGASFYPTLDGARERSEDLDKKIPAWAQGNPIQRIASVTVIENKGNNTPQDLVKEAIAYLTQNRTYPADVKAALRALKELEGMME